MTDQDKIIRIPTKKIATLKNGEVKEYIYDQSIYNKKYYIKNKEGYNKKTICICGSNVFNSNMKKHISGKKHQDYINNLESNIIDNIDKIDD